MALIVDAGALCAQADGDDPEHAAVVRLLRAETGAIVTTELALAEADYLILDRLTEGTFTVECLGRGGLVAARELVERHRELRIGLADASLVGSRAPQADAEDRHL